MILNKWLIGLILGSVILNTFAISRLYSRFDTLERLAIDLLTDKLKVKFAEMELFTDED